MTDPQHALMAIDIALEPDAVMMSRAFAANAALRENVPQGFALDATNHAHITLLQRFVRTADLPSIYAATEEILAREKYTGWKLTAFKYYYVPAGPIGLAGIVVEPTTASAVVVAPAKVAPPLKAIEVDVALEGNGYAKVVAAVR